MRGPSRNIGKAVEDQEQQIKERVEKAEKAVFATPLAICR
jgi:hypothetical protein